jgi:hypothetical protein
MESITPVMVEKIGNGSVKKDFMFVELPELVLLYSWQAIMEKSESWFGNNLSEP